jgi:hypothetical protein
VFETEVKEVPLVAGGEVCNTVVTQCGREPRVIDSAVRKSRFGCMLPNNVHDLATQHNIYDRPVRVGAIPVNDPYGLRRR